MANQSIKSPKETTTAQKSGNVDLAMELFQRLFPSEKKDKTTTNNGVNDNGYDSSSDEELLGRLICRVKLFPDESDCSEESECDDNLKTFIDDSLICGDWAGIEDHFLKYLRQNKGRISLVDALKIIHCIIQPKIRRKLRKIVLLHFKADKLKMSHSRRSLMVQEETVHRVKVEERAAEHNETEDAHQNNNIMPERHQDKSNNRMDIASDEASSRQTKYERKRRSLAPDGDNDNGQNRRRSGRLSSHAAGYFQTQPIYRIYVHQDVPTKAEARKRKHHSSNVTPDTKRKKNKAGNVNPIQSTLKKKSRKSHSISNKEKNTTAVVNQSLNNEHDAEHVDHVHCLSDDMEGEDLHPLIQKNKRQDKLKMSHSGRSLMVQEETVHRVKVEERTVEHNETVVKKEPIESVSLVTSDEDDDITESNKARKSTEDEIISKKEKLSRKDSFPKRHKSTPALARKNRSYEELSTQDEGPSKKVSKKRSRLSLPDTRSVRSSSRLSSHPVDFFKPKPFIVEYMTPAGNSSKGTRKMCSTDDT